MKNLNNIVKNRIKGKSVSEIYSWFNARLRQQIHSRCRTKTVRNAAIKLSQLTIGKEKIKFNNSLLIEKDRLNKHLQNLETKGYSFADKNISEILISNIVNYSNDLFCFDPYQKEVGSFKPEQANKKSHIAHFKRNDLILKKEIMDLANDEGILNLMQEFLGAKPTISNVCMWWSFGGREGAQEAQNFHRDNDDIKFCKLFIYLTDVSENQGPHIYVEGTSNSPKLRKVRRYEDKEIENEFGKENILTFSYPKGTVFLADTYGFHKGLPPSEGNRLLLQIEYSLYPIGYQDYDPIDVNYSNSYNKYSNRLLVKS